MMDARLKRIKELFSESEKRNGELAHENFELKKRIAEQEEIGIVRCEMCKYWSLEKELTRLNGERYTVGYCCLEDKYSDCDWFCADGERR